MENQSAIIFAILLLAKEFDFIVFMHSFNNDEIFLGKHEFVSFSNKQLEINSHLMTGVKQTEAVDGNP